MRASVVFELTDVPLFKKQLAAYAKNHLRFCILSSNEWQNSDIELMAAVDSMDEIIPTRNSFEALKKFHKEKKDWLFGFMSYDATSFLQQAQDKLSHLQERGAQFPLMHFFQPKYVFVVRTNKVEIHFLPKISSDEEVKNVFEEIMLLQPTAGCRLPTVDISQKISEGEYIRIVKRIKNHIQRGDIYEMNFCMEFFSEEASINPEVVFLKLNEISQAPFSAFYRMNNHYLMCASPERFLRKEGKKIISQPIKGTARRGETESEDMKLKEQLLHNNKDRSENVMIVDLVRNDLSRTCDHVKVDELFGIYSFAQWHQMISTVSGEIKDDVHFTEVIENAFPMGSMTGAPKIRAMELIEQYEKTKRGLYSGSVGYITPQGDFDFNVVIRSVLYNSASKYLSFSVGSAITASSVPEDEYEECLLKARGVFEALGKNDESQTAANGLKTLSHA